MEKKDSALTLTKSAISGNRDGQIVQWNDNSALTRNEQLEIL